MLLTDGGRVVHKSRGITGEGGRACGPCWQPTNWDINVDLAVVEAAKRGENDRSGCLSFALSGKLLFEEEAFLWVG